MTDARRPGTTGKDEPASHPPGLPEQDLPELFSDLVRLQIELWNALDVRLRDEHGLSLSRYEAMAAIAARPCCRVRDLMSTLVITIGGASKLVDRVEASGHCRRLPNPQDGRSSHLELTDLGRRVLERARATVDEELQQSLGARLTVSQLRDLGGLVATARAGSSRARPDRDGDRGDPDLA